MRIQSGIQAGVSSGFEGEISPRNTPMAMAQRTCT